MSEMMMVQPSASGNGYEHVRNEECDKFGCVPVEPVPTTTDIDPSVLKRVVTDENGLSRGEEVRVTSTTGGQKGSKLARFDLIPAEALWQVAELYGVGAAKYAPWNWRKGYDWSLSIAALERHLSLFKSGEDIDSETGMPHLTSIVFHALTLLTFMREQPDFDDRWKK